MTTGERIALARKRAGLTQQELAQLLGVTVQAVSQHERGVRKPSAKNIKCYATVLNVKYEDLVGSYECDEPSDNSLVVYAKGSDEVELLRWFRSLSLTKRILFLGYVSKE